MTRIHIGEPHEGRVEPRHDGGGVGHASGLSMQRGSESFGDLHRIGGLRRDQPEHRAQGGMQQGRGNAFAGDVADEHERSAQRGARALIWKWC